MNVLRISVEGETERDFVNQLLVPHLRSHGVEASATLVGKMTAQRRSHTQRGGGHFANWEKDLRHLISGRDAPWVTTLYDLYGLPDDFPGLAQHRADSDTARRCANLERALAERLGDPHRFIPYLQRHEFEALVLASLSGLEAILDPGEQLDGLRSLRESIANRAPEDVNDGKTSAPSKRLIQAINGYDKRVHGILAIEEVGLAEVRQRCPSFHEWMTRLESLGQ